MQLYCLFQACGCLNLIKTWLVLHLKRDKKLSPIFLYQEMQIGKVPVIIVPWALLLRAIRYVVTKVEKVEIYWTAATYQIWKAITLLAAMLVGWRKFMSL
jgi:hypothetical protein